jgi:chromosome segregation ATPase
MFAVMSIEWLVALMGAVGLLSTAIGAAAGKLLPEWIKAKDRDAENERKGLALEAKLKREAVHETRNEYAVIINRKDADIIQRDKVIDGMGKKIDAMYEQIHRLMAEHTSCLIANEKLAARIAVLETKIERYRVERLTASPEPVTDEQADSITEGWHKEAKEMPRKSVVAMPQSDGSTIVSVPPGSNVSVGGDSMKVDVGSEKKEPKE